MFLSLVNVSCIIFYNYQRHYICLAIDKFYWREQVYTLWLQCPELTIIVGKILEENYFTNHVLSGNRICDSLGNSVKYDTYSLMKTSGNKILHFEKVDEQEIYFWSPNMERESKVCCLNLLFGKGTIMIELVTDSSSFVASTLGKHITWVTSCSLWIFIPWCVA